MTHIPRILPAAVLAATLSATMPTGAPAQEAAAMAALLQQGAHWRQQNRPDLALRTFERVLTADARNVEALAGAAQAQAMLGNRAASEALLVRLRQNAPADRRLAETEGEVRAGLDQEGVAEARRLAQAGRGTDAVARYRQAFGAAPPESLAPEFYSVLASAEGGHTEARDALAALAARSPGNGRLQLSHAQVLTYREATRAAGIARLRQLGADPATGPGAAAPWRQALLWQGTTAEAIPELEAFLQRYPNDPAITRRLAEARTSRPGETPGDSARQQGFEALNIGRLRDAARGFEAALAVNPQDSNALGGLGVIRLRENRAAEARDLLERAVAAAPERRAQWQRALDAAAYSTELAQGRAQLRANENEAAEATLRRAAAREVTDRADAEALLGDLALRRNEPTAAETRYRAALARRPDFGAAIAGLSRALRQQGRVAEADTLARRIAPIGGVGQPTGRGAALREEAARAIDPEAASALLRSAVAVEPANPWIRLDLARALRRQGQGAEARALMEALTSGQSGAEASYAAALYAEEDGRLGDAAALLNRVPARLRTADMGRLLARARVAADVAVATDAARAGGFEGRQRLLAIAARPDPSGAAAAAVIRGFGRLGDGRSADEAARVALASNRDAPSSARLAIAGALLEAGQETTAATMLRGLEGDARLSVEDRRQAVALQSGIAVRGSDRLNEQGEQAAGFDRLRPVLARNPDDPAANLALARLHASARQPREASRIAEAVLTRHPRNLDARAAAVEAALANRDLRRAEALVAEARAMAPNEARVLLMEARTARAAGDGRRALRALEAAAEQRRAQLGEDVGSLPTASFPGVGFRPSSVDNPFRRPEPVSDGEATPSRDAISAEIARELAAVRDDTSPRISGSPGIRSRSGSAGLDRLAEISSTAEGSFSPGGLGGRLSLRVTPVAIDSGDIDRNEGSLRRFGSNPSAGSGGFRVPGSQSASGVGVGLAYRRDWLAADVGSTPIGFPSSNLVGGVEIFPSLGDNLRLRLIGERRAVTDSVLSWAGTRDPLSGRNWGGVTRTGGRGQLELTAGPANFYVGGGYATLEGNNVAGNTRIEVGAGMSYPVFRRPEEEMTAGIDLVYFGYDRNLRFFTLGHGGYFSPQSYAAINLPVDYRARSGNFSYRIGGTVGFADWREDAASVFPDDPELQGRLAADASEYPRKSQSGVVGGLRGDIDYALTPQLRIGGQLRYDRSARWNEARGLIFLGYRFDQ